MHSIKILLTILPAFILANPLSPPYNPTCAQCVPIPLQDKCHITTSCTVVSAHKGNTPKPIYCACRHGYRASGQKPGDDSVQWRLPWYEENGVPSQEGRVFVKPGVVCDQLCDQWWLGKDGCKEVKLKSDCL